MTDQNAFADPTTPLLARINELEAALKKAANLLSIITWSSSLPPLPEGALIGLANGLRQVAARKEDAK